MIAFLTGAVIVNRGVKHLPYLLTILIGLNCRRRRPPVRYAGVNNEVRPPVGITYYRRTIDQQ